MNKNIDLEDIKERLNLNDKELNDVFIIFLEEIDQIIMKLRELVKNENNNEELRKEIHTLKGIALNIGFKLLYIKLKKYHESIMEKETIDKKYIVEDIIFSIEQIKEELKSL